MEWTGETDEHDGGKKERKRIKAGLPKISLFGISVWFPAALMKHRDTAFHRGPSGPRGPFSSKKWKGGVGVLFVTGDGGPCAISVFTGHLP